MNYGASGLAGQYMASLEGDPTAFGASGGSSIFGAVPASLELDAELAYGGFNADSAEEALSFGALDSESLEDELAYGALDSEPLEDELAYGGDDELYGAFEKATAKGRIAKLYRIAGRIQYLVDIGKVDTARTKAQKLLQVWEKLSAMPDAKPLISDALQDVVAGLSAFASGQVNNPHDVAATQVIQPGVAVDPTMTGGQWLGASVAAEQAALFGPNAAVAPMVIQPYVRPVRPLPPRLRPPPIGLGRRARVRGGYGGLEEGYGDEDYGVEHVSQDKAKVRTYRIRKGPGAGTMVQTTLGPGTFKRCRKLAKAMRAGSFQEPGSRGLFRYPVLSGPHMGKVVITDLPSDAFAECVKVNRVGDRGTSFGSILGFSNMGTDGLGGNRSEGLTPSFTREGLLFGENYGSLFASALSDEE